MNLELRALSDPGNSLSEVITGFLDALEDDMRRLADDPGTRIHDIRVGTKKLGALLRLCGRVIDRDDLVAARALLRAIRGEFSGSRDIAVVRHRLEELFPGSDGAAAAEIRLPEPVETGLPDPAGPLRQVEELRRLVGRIPFSAVTPPTVLRAVLRSYRKARRLHRRCEKDPSDNAQMHDWRKRTKDFCYHAFILAEAKPLKKLAPALDALAEALGEFHDLVVVEDHASDHPLIRAEAGTRKSTIQHECFRTGRSIFSRKPSALRKKLKSHFPL